MAYSLGPEVEQVAKPLIEANHRHLLTASITFLFRDRSWKTKDGMTILGKAKGRTEIDKLLSQKREDFLVIIGKDRWDEMTEQQREQLVDHELCHCGVMVTNSGEQKWFIREHAIAEFPENLARYDFKREELGHLIENPPSAVVAQAAPLRKIRQAAEEI